MRHARERLRWLIVRGIAILASCGPSVEDDGSTGSMSSGDSSQDAVYRNRRRMRGRRGKHLMRKRGELIERPFAHMHETGGMRRLHLRGHDNILKRLLIHAAGANLGLLMRTLVGVGRPRSLQGRRGLVAELLRALMSTLTVLWDWWTTCIESVGPIEHSCPDGWLAWPSRPVDGLDHESGYEPAFTTGC